jgi:hypothetical protein
MSCADMMCIAFVGMHGSGQWRSVLERIGGANSKL